MTITLGILFVERKISHLPASSLRFVLPGETKPIKTLSINSSFQKNLPQKDQQHKIILALPYDRSLTNVRAKLSIELQQNAPVEVVFQLKSPQQKLKNDTNTPSTQIISSNYQTKTFAKSWKAHPVTPTENAQNFSNLIYRKKIVLPDIFFENYLTAYELFIKQVQTSHMLIQKNRYTVSLTTNSCNKVHEREPFNDDFDNATIVPNFDVLMQCNFDSQEDRDYFAISDAIQMACEQNPDKIPSFYMKSSVPIRIKFLQSFVEKNFSTKKDTSSSHTKIIDLHIIDQILDEKNVLYFIKTIPLPTLKKVKNLLITPLLTPLPKKSAVGQADFTLPWDYKFKLLLQ